MNSSDHQEHAVQPNVQNPQPYTTQLVIPGTGLSIAGFVVSLVALFSNFFLLGLPAVVGLTLSIVGRVLTTKANRPSGLALAGIIIAGISIVLTVAVWVLVFLIGLQNAAESSSRPIELFN